ncbi:hypothetical protein F5I97DRAFT_1873517 [Phlebopus sp. FC_14]|nr:hypothetical protein F5I97DRAFT_1873517 [Phlebopus sp. FC_14]
MGCSSSRPKTLTDDSVTRTETQRSEGRTPNVVVFGFSGAGVGYLVNLIIGLSDAATSGDAETCTKEVSRYPTCFNDRSFNVYDVPGFKPNKSPGKFPSEPLWSYAPEIILVKYAVAFLKDLWPHGGSIPVILVVAHSRPPPVVFIYIYVTINDAQLRTSVRHVLHASI